jgi:hypothetical protein
MTVHNSNNVKDWVIRSQGSYFRYAKEKNKVQRLNVSGSERV